MTFLTHPEPPMDSARAKRYEAAFTPYPIALQCLYVAAARLGVGFGRAVSTVLDPSAGAGVWCQAMRAVFGTDVFVYAVEARDEERRWLDANASDHHIGDFLELGLSPGAFCLAATNPPFSLFAEFAEEGLRVADECWLYAPCDISMRAEPAAQWMAENQKWIAAEFVTPGPVAFTASRTADFRTYSLWCFSHSAQTRKLSVHGGWYREVLPMLPSCQRKWSVRPGTEPQP